MSFCIWAPKCRQIDVVIENGQPQSIPLEKKEDGYFIGRSGVLPPGTLYRYRINGDKTFPDPCSRYQPDGPHGSSMIIDANHYQWHDQDWVGVEMKGQVFYEIHIGGFTPRGRLMLQPKNLRN